MSTDTNTADTRYYFAEEPGCDYRTEWSMLGPDDEDQAGNTPSDVAENVSAFGLQLNDYTGDPTILVGELYALEKLLKAALEKVQGVIAEQREDGNL